MPNLIWIWMVALQDPNLSLLFTDILLNIFSV